MRILVFVLVALAALVAAAPPGAAPARAASPEGQVRWGVHTTLVPT